LQLYDLPTTIEEGISAEQLVARMAWDKKVKDGHPRLVLSPKIGDVVVKDDVPMEVILPVLRRMGAV
jgi:3-dehydroquinate synthetase